MRYRAAAFKKTFFGPKQLCDIPQVVTRKHLTTCSLSGQRFEMLMEEFGWGMLYLLPKAFYIHDFFWTFRDNECCLINRGLRNSLISPLLKQLCASLPKI